MSWISEYNATFFLAVGSITSASFAILLRYIFKSKCRRFSCCGITVERDVDAELEEQRIELQEHPNKKDGGATNVETKEEV
jgi:hypothetical protein